MIVLHWDILENPQGEGRTNMALGSKRWTSSSSSATIIMDTFPYHGSQFSHVLGGMELNCPIDSKLVSSFEVIYWE